MFKKKLIFIFVLVLIAGANALGQCGSGHEKTPSQPRHGSFEIRQTQSGRYSFVLKASNGREILSGFFYASVDKVKDAIEKTRTLATEDTNFDVRHDNQWYFFVKDANGKAVAQSEHYTTEAAMRKGIDSVRKTAPDATVSDPS
ncbi:MAG TPA: YegP family protein [Pyrinomonadaceae bacterium]|jgi:uncharacterized protein YegP (UPF0339 family)|nr:YegP family protein [Pyrinomonadaceae bacterium]